MPSIVTPISHLFEVQDHADLIIAHSDKLECRDHSTESDVLLQTLFHCELQPCHQLEETDFRYLEKVKKIKPELELISFHLASSCHSPELKNGIFMPGAGGHEYSDIELLQNARVNFSRIKNIFGPGIKIAIENNNFYPTLAYQFITDPEFISEIVFGNDISFLYDIAHAKVSSYNLGVSYEVYKKGLPLKNAIQLHICKSGINEEMAYDAHFIPDEEEWAEVSSLLETCKTIQYLTVEYYRDVNGLIDSLKYLKKIIS